MDVLFVLAGISVVLFFGFLAELVFRKLHVPDILLLIIFGFLIGPYAIGYIQPYQLVQIAPLFTTFTLLFLVYNGALEIDLKSLASGLKKSLGFMTYNIVLSVAVVTLIMYLATGDLLFSLMLGLIVSSTSSEFIPLMGKLGMKRETYSALMLEATLTDVFTIVFPLVIMEMIASHAAFDAPVTALNIGVVIGISLVLGAVSAAIWAFVLLRLFKGDRPCMLTIAYLVMVYVVTEYLKGNGVMAVLVFGLLLRNAKEIGALLERRLRRNLPDLPQEDMTVVSKTEIFFYSQISFFLKTFFFVYVGLLIDLSDGYSLFLGIAIATALMLARSTSSLVTQSFSRFDRGMISAMSARGLATAAIAQEAVVRGIAGAGLLVNVAYVVIVFTIVLSSLNIFAVRVFVKPEERTPG